MSIEAALFFLRLLIALSLLGFLLALFAICWRSLKLMERQLRAASQSQAYLRRQVPEGTQPDEAAHAHPLEAITTLGRAKSNAIVVDDDFASARHARIVLENGQWWLEDRRSRNGTRLNDAPIDRRTILADGDVIGIGSASYRLSLGAEAESTEG